MKTIEFNEFADEAEVSHFRKTHPYDVVVGRNVRRVRTSRGLSREELASRMGYTHQQLCKQEFAINRISVSALLLLAENLNCDVSELLSGASGGQRNPVPTPSEEFSAAELRVLTNFRALRRIDRVAVAKFIRTMASDVR